MLFYPVVAETEMWILPRQYCPSQLPNTIINLAILNQKHLEVSSSALTPVGTDLVDVTHFSAESTELSHPNMPLVSLLKRVFSHPQCHSTRQTASCSSPTLESFHNTSYHPQDVGWTLSVWKAPPWPMLYSTFWPSLSPTPSVDKRNHLQFSKSVM